MPALVLLGAQWGDEGKGKATDLLPGWPEQHTARCLGRIGLGHHLGHIDRYWPPDSKYLGQILVRKLC